MTATSIRPRDEQFETQNTVQVECLNDTLTPCTATYICVDPCLQTEKIRDPCFLLRKDPDNPVVGL